MGAVWDRRVCMKPVGARETGGRTWDRWACIGPAGVMGPAGDMKLAGDMGLVGTHGTGGYTWDWRAHGGAAKGQGSSGNAQNFGTGVAGVKRVHVLVIAPRRAHILCITLAAAKPSSRSVDGIPRFTGDLTVSPRRALNIHAYNHDRAAPRLHPLHRPRGCGTTPAALSTAYPRSDGNLPTSTRRALNVSIQCAAAAPALSPCRPHRPSRLPAALQTAPRLHSLHRPHGGCEITLPTLSVTYPASFGTFCVFPSHIECQRAAVAPPFPHATLVHRPSRIPTTPALQINPQTLLAISYNEEIFGGFLFFCEGGKFAAVVAETKWPDEAQADGGLVQLRVVHLAPHFDADTGYQALSGISFSWAGPSIASGAQGNITASVSVGLGDMSAPKGGLHFPPPPC
ncbi:hypothetical protein FIBSPDRAFT_944160 [Athelia psychrophila]|uniref:Uncharacterized protein n=1 Tax=Athelia psychrophila TaxID=1759441 RepID=A0A166VEH7_9AGAM|nr:hypothetical protein FIBSPDRAFT_944160 [Fibularhizoctonia sp. CBS 109695]